MFVRSIYANNSLRNFSYLIYDSNGKALCIDPWDARPILALTKEFNLNLIAILNTHEHHDHIRGNEKLAEITKAPIYAYAGAPIPNIARELYAGDVIEFSAGNYIECLDTPGHTNFHLSYVLYIEHKLHAVFSGDTMFYGGVGNCHSGDARVLYKTISEHYATLIDSTLLYPGHDYIEKNLHFTLQYDTENLKARNLLNNIQQLKESHYPKVRTIGEEKEINLFLRLHEEGLYKELAKYSAKKLSEDKSEQAFLLLRNLRDNF